MQEYHSLVCLLNNFVSVTVPVNQICVTREVDIWIWEGGEIGSSEDSDLEAEWVISICKLLTPASYLEMTDVLSRASLGLSLGGLALPSCERHLTGD